MYDDYDPITDIQREVMQDIEWNNYDDNKKYED